jgi:hypothetical protein
MNAPYIGRDTNNGQPTGWVGIFESESLAQRILVGPVMSDERLVDDDDRKRRFRIRFREIASHGDIDI